MDKKKLIEQIVALLGAASCREVELVLVMLRRLLGVPEEAKP